MKYLAYTTFVLILLTNIVFATTKPAVPVLPTAATITIPTKSQVVNTITTTAAPVEKSLLAKLDSFRIDSKISLEAKRDEVKKRIASQLATTGQRVLNDSLGVNQPSPANINQTQPNYLGSPEDYVLFTIYAGLATIFENSFYFYAVCVFIALALVRAIFRRAF